MADRAPTGGGVAVLHGREVALRARVESDIPLLHSGLYEDVDTRAAADGRAWRPMAPDAEGTLRDAGWVSGRFVDEVVLGLLAEDWHEAHPDVG